MTIAELRTVGAAVRSSFRSAPRNATVALDLSFRSLGGCRIHGYAITWADRSPGPVIVHAHGDRSQATQRLPQQKGAPQAGIHPKIHTYWRGAV